MPHLDHQGGQEDGEKRRGRGLIHILVNYGGAILGFVLTFVKLCFCTEKP